MLPLTVPRVLAIPVACLCIATGVCMAAGCGNSTGNSHISDHRVSASTTESPHREFDTFDVDYGSTVAANQAGHRWAPAATATITPGMQTYTRGMVPCTANYVFVDDSDRVYIGQAAHCATTGQVLDVNGCTAGSLPVGTAVSFKRSGTPVSGATAATGRLAYSSWSTMQRIREKDRNTCAYNDFALVRLAADDVGKVNPSLPHWGGPVGINTAGTTAGEILYSYWNSFLRAGVVSLSPQTGVSKTDDAAAGGWNHAFVAHFPGIPGIPGDSGSPFLDRAGRAVGTLSTLGISLPVVDNIGDIGRELAYARAHSGISGLRLVLGTEPFHPGR